MNTARDVASNAGSIYVVGAGRVGTTLAKLFLEAGINVIGLWSKSKDEAQIATKRTGLNCDFGPFPKSIANAQIIIISVRDTAINDVARDLSKAGLLNNTQVVLHCNGSQAARDVMYDLPSDLAIGTFHPLLAFVDPEQSHLNVAGAYFALEGDDRAVKTGALLADVIGVHSFRLTSKQMPLYHAAAVIASNHTVCLWHVAQKMLQKIGLKSEQAKAALIPLLRSTLENVERLGLPDALTGPVRRGDVDTIKHHLLAINESLPEVVALYKAATQATVEVARICQSSLSDEDLNAILQVLKN